VAIPGAAPASARRLAGDTWVLEDLTNSGYLGGLLVDTGPDAVAYLGAPTTELMITHGHADHFACAAALRRESGMRVFSAREDASLIENPDINIRGMFSWAKPGDLFVTKLFRGEGCEVDGYLDQWSHPRVTAIPLPGHTLGHTGLLTDDGVLFTGDALYLEELWERHPLPYAIDADLVAASLLTIRGLDFDWLVPAHGRVIERAEAPRHIDFHIAQIRAIEEFIVERLREARTTEEIIADVSRERGISDNPAQYWLAVTTVKGFLGGLLERERIRFIVREHVGCWQAV
jgi:glyoxylase-like metal-dependent hydrolase (beta-lactamase superfamily II)